MYADDKSYPQAMVEGNTDEQLDDGWAFEIDDGWGWEVEIDGDSQSAAPNSPGGLRISLKPTVPRALSKSQESELSLISRVKSSSSFQELERAIGATLAMGLGEVDLSKKDEHMRVINGVISQKATLGKNLRMRSYGSMTRFRSDSLGSRDSEVYRQSHLVASEMMKADIKPFLDEPESRALVVFHSPDVTSYDIKTTCKMFGSLFYFRSDFHSFGITLVCYCDLRCAVDAHRSLRSRLGRLADATPYFSVILHCMHGCDESKLCISPVPADMSETDVQGIFSRYGHLRSIQKSFNDGGVASTLSTTGTSPTLTTCDYTVEYFSIQDAKVAQVEIQASIHTIVGPGTDVYFVVFDRRQEQARKDALTILHSWRVRLEEMEGGEHARSPTHRLRHVPDKATAPTPLPPAPLPMPLPAAVPPSTMSSRPKPHVSPRDPGRPPANIPTKPHHEAPPEGSAVKLPPSRPGAAPPPSPPGMYYPSSPHGMVPMGGPVPGMYHMVPAPYYGHMSGMVHVPVHHTHTGAGAHLSSDAYGRAHYVSPAAHPYMAGAYYVPYGGAPVPMPMSAPVGGMPLSPSGSFENLQFAMDEHPQSPYDYSQQGQGHQGYGYGYGYDSNRHSRGHRGGMTDRRPPHHNGGHSVMGRRGGGGQGRSQGGAPDPADTADYVLSPDRLGSGSEKRTTVMIRNIPNKYSQSMLLEEINAKFDGMYDFFYLPIDFKNKCNVGYAFINFLEPSTVIQFVDEFNGQRWRNFNSEKVCSISYARIQGKAAMIARFQNSSLLEKDDSFKPLLFVSKGANKGAPEAFPSRQEGILGNDSFVAGPRHH